MNDEKTNKILLYIFGENLGKIIDKEKIKKELEELNLSKTTNERYPYTKYPEKGQSVGFMGLFERKKSKPSRSMNYLLTHEKYQCNSCYDPTSTIYCNNCKKLFHLTCVVDNDFDTNAQDVFCPYCEQKKSSKNPNIPQNSLNTTDKSKLDLLSILAVKEYANLSETKYTSKYEFASISKLMIKLKTVLTEDEMKKLASKIVSLSGIKLSGEESIKENNIGKNSPELNFILGLCQLEKEENIEEIAGLVRSMLLADVKGDGEENKKYEVELNSSGENNQ